MVVETAAVVMLHHPVEPTAEVVVVLPFQRCPRHFGKCRDPRPPWLDAPFIDPLEGMPLPNARLKKDEAFTDDDNPVTGDDL